MTELLHTISPVGAQGEVVHGEGRVARGVTLHPGGAHVEVPADGGDLKAEGDDRDLLEEGRDRGRELLILGGCEGLEKDESLAAGVAGGPVDVQLGRAVSYTLHGGVGGHFIATLLLNINSRSRLQIWTFT